ncbi:MAG: hypothetical protein HC939_09120 [Pleurocapsa sp. SU_5_0]|nr:hypothetical protein [Pleurocapsa sp. SU_5_0]NJO96278.1 hypothetical protein [Pleurocapsa sp. CRU_1_2]NJR46528.1 hypothetical protein [Hyellaceae cyanobacterium CSU_1_1]
MMNLNRKRRQSCLIILATVFGSAVVAATPKANLDSAKQIFLTVADVAMCMVIWDIYFEESLYQKNIISILLELFFVIILSAVTAYIASKGITVLGDRLIPWLGAMGWWIVGAIASVAACFIGVAWTFYCDDLYRS